MKKKAKSMELVTAAPLRGVSPQGAKGEDGRRERGDDRGR